MALPKFNVGDVILDPSNPKHFAEIRSIVGGLYGTCYYVDWHGPEQHTLDCKLWFVHTDMKYVKATDAAKVLYGEQ